MSNGESVLINIRKMVENGEELSVKEFRIFMLSTAIDGEKARKSAAKERKKILDTVDDKIQCLEDKIDDHPEMCSQAETNKEEIDRLRNKSDRNDVLVTMATIASGIGAAIFGSK